MNNKHPTYRGEHRPFSVAIDTKPDGIKSQIKNFCGYQHKAEGKTKAISFNGGSKPVGKTAKISFL